MLTSNITKATFLDLCREFAVAQETVSNALADRRDVKARIKEAGITPQLLERALKEAGREGDDRDALDIEYRRYMVWLGRPLGTQAELFEAHDPTANGPAPEDIITLFPPRRRRRRPAAKHSEQPDDAQVPLIV
jgi:hypothetical protein